jgi:hypothetical protein
MSALRNVLAGGVVAAALIGAAPASAQIFPGYGYGSPYGGGYGSDAVIGQVLGQVIAGSMGGYGGYSPYGGYASPYGGYGNPGINSQALVNQCMGAVQARLNGGRVLGVSRVEQRNGGGLNVRGVANSGRAGAYAYTYGAQAPVDLTFTCRTDFRGMITDVDIDRAQANYGSNYTPYGNQYGATPYGTGAYGNNYSNYGYSRY